MRVLQWNQGIAVKYGSAQTPSGNDAAKYKEQWYMLLSIYQTSNFNFKDSVFDIIEDNTVI